jgi:hypothetical protein
MKLLKITPLILLVSITVQLNAQDTIQQDPNLGSRQIDKVSIGIGAGLDYGGCGGNVIYYPIKNVGLFGGVGYALAGAGYNVGVKYRYIPDKPNSKIDPFGMIMYGYNAAIAVLNASEYNKLFFGPTLGIGIDFHRKPMNKGYWSFALLIPIRSSAVNEYMDDLENNHGAEFQNRLFPVGITVGYKFIIHK